jgi:alpha/beta superfamily hydrolase
MKNNVVETIVRAGQRVGVATLRFNFRGVGRSEGEYAEGTGEEADIGAALDFLERSFSIGTTILVGYSFGACVALAYCHRSGHRVDHLLLISPPPFLLPEALSLEASVVRKIMVGEKDQIAAPDAIKARVSATRVEELVEVIPGADHFFWGREEDLEKRLVRILNV